MRKPITNLLWKKENFKIILIEFFRDSELRAHRIPDVNEAGILKVLKGKVRIQDII